MKKTALTLLAFGFAATAACAASPSKALPAGSDKFPTTTTTPAVEKVAGVPPVSRTQPCSRSQAMSWCAASR